MSDDVQIYGGAYGRRLSSDKPDNHLADLDSHLAASPDRVKHARRYWQERDAGDFEAVGTTGRRVVDRATGEEYVVVGHDPLQGGEPEKELVEFFLIRAGQLFFLKPRGAVDQASVGVGLSAATIAGKIKQDARGRPLVVDAVGHVVPTRLTEAR